MFIARMVFIIWTYVVMYVLIWPHQCTFYVVIWRVTKRDDVYENQSPVLGGIGIHTRNLNDRITIITFF